MTVDYLNSKEKDGDESPMTRERLAELERQYPDTPRRKEADG